MALAPTNNTRLRSATETELPTAALICVVSAVSREITSPVLASSKKAARQRGHVRENVAAQIGDDALAERGDEVVAKRACQREHAADADHDQEVAVDQRETARSEAEIDHAAHSDRDERAWSAPRGLRRRAPQRRASGSV